MLPPQNWLGGDSGVQMFQGQLEGSPEHDLSTKATGGTVGFVSYNMTDV